MIDAEKKDMILRGLAACLPEIDEDAKIGCKDCPYTDSRKYGGDTVGMKAWNVSDANGNTGVNYIIFAESRGKAIRHALDYCDGAFDWCSWTEMRAIRMPALDDFYRGKSEMDWCNMDDRVAMVRYAGFYCSDEVTVTVDKCQQCPAHFWCDRLDRMLR